jgi:CRP-like cAMP-binding protein
MIYVDDLIETVELFYGFSPDELEHLLAAGVERRLAAGEVLRRVGDLDESLFIVISGRLDVQGESGADRVVLASLTPYAACGEMSLATGYPRTADLVAAAESVVLELSREAIDQALADLPHVAVRLWRNVAGLLARRLARTNSLVGRYAEINRTLTEDHDAKQPAGEP